MTVFAGLEFKRVSPGYAFRGDTVIVIKDCSTGAMFVKTCQKQNNYTSVMRYKHNPLKLLKTDPNSTLFNYYVFHRLATNLPEINEIAENVKIELTKTNSLWSNRFVIRKGAVIDMEKLNFYIYAMISENSGAVYFDYDHCEKIFINPMNKKAATYNGFVLRQQMHHNRTMHHYTKNNFPIKPSEWFSVKIGELVTGRENASNQVSRLSVDLIRKNYLVLNRVYGADSHHYRQHYSGLSSMGMESYVNINRDDTFDVLEHQMVT